MAKVWIKGIPWPYETGSMVDFPKEGEYLRLPNKQYYKVISNLVPHDVVWVKREDVPQNSKIHYLHEPGTVGFDRNGPIVKR